MSKLPIADREAIYQAIRRVCDLLDVDTTSGSSTANIRNPALRRLIASNSDQSEYSYTPGTIPTAGPMMVNGKQTIDRIIAEFFDSKKLRGAAADAFRTTVLPAIYSILQQGADTMFDLAKILVTNSRMFTFDGNGNAEVVPPSPTNGYGYLDQREFVINTAVTKYQMWAYSLPEYVDLNSFSSTVLPDGGEPYASYSSSTTRIYPLQDELNKQFDVWIRQILEGQADQSDQWQGKYTWSDVGQYVVPPSETTGFGYSSSTDGYKAPAWQERDQTMQAAIEALQRLEVTPPSPDSSAWSGLSTAFGQALSATSGSQLPIGGPGFSPPPFNPSPPYVPPPNPPNPPGPPNPPNPPNPPGPPNPPNPPGPPVGGPGGPPVSVPPVGAPLLGAVLGGGLGVPGVWPDNTPNQFQEPRNLQDVAREIIRKQNGGNRLLLITHFGRADANTWLVTIADQGNTNFTQDPGDPGSAAGDRSGGSGAATAASSTPGATGAPDAPVSGAFSLNGAGDPNAYLNNSQSITMELGGTLSPYGKFVAESIQRYCTLQPPIVATSAQSYDSSSLARSDAGSVLGSLSPSALGGSSSALAGPPTSPQNPALLWLIGHGLGGMVAQNLASQVPFPGDNPNLGPAHIVKGVIALGAPIVGTIAKGVAYSFFKIPGERIGDVPVDAVGVNDARTKDVQMLPNPFLSPPWQSQDPSKPNYVKDPRDPATIHSGYADSPALARMKLPFALKKGLWGPTYVIPIPAASPSTAATAGVSGVGVG